MTILPQKAMRTCQRVPPWKRQRKCLLGANFESETNRLEEEVLSNHGVFWEPDRLPQQGVSASSPEECKKDWVDQVAVLLSPNSYCSPDDWPINREVRY